jgi:hypothetical protein
MSLIKEFAIDPSVMARWSLFDTYWEDFGVEKGRLISKYPILWKIKVDELARKLSKSVQASAISSKIRKDSYKFLDTGRTYDGKADWLENVAAQQGNQPFHAVVAYENPKGHTGILIPGEFAKDEPPYKVLAEDFVPRASVELAACARLLLVNCSEIQFIDPYFDPSEPRFRNTFGAMLGLCSRGVLKHIEIHREKPVPYLPNVQLDKYQRRLDGLVPKGLRLKVFFWGQTPGGMEMHPRFLLTDLGGIHFENGLDEGKPGEMTLVRGVSHPIWEKCRNLYSQKGGAFALAPDCVLDIEGKK